MWFNCLRHFPPQHCQVETAGRIEPSPKTPRNNLRIHTHTYYLSIHPNGRPTVVFKVYICQQATIRIWRKEPVRSLWPGLTYTQRSTSKSNIYDTANIVLILSVFAMFSCYIRLFFIQGHCHVIAKPIARKPIRASLNFWVPDRGLAKGRNKKMKVKQNSASRCGYAGD